MAIACAGLNGSDHIRVARALIRLPEPTAPVGDPSWARSHLGWRPTVSSERVVQRMVDADLRALGGGCAKRIARATGQTPTVDRVRKRVLLQTSWASARRAIRCRSSVSPARSSVAYAGVAQARTDRGLTSGAGQNQWSGGRRRGECSPCPGERQSRSRRSSAYWPATGGSPASGPAARSGGRRGPRPGWSVGRHPRAPDDTLRDCLTADEDAVAPPDECASRTPIDHAVEPAAALQGIASARLVGVGIVALDDNQRSFRARRSAASPRRSTSQCAWTRTPRRPRCRSERRSSSGHRGVGGAWSGPARSRVEQADGRRGGSSKR